jgi:redox-sensitive bicupin YhaK (pirin superfamily)
MDRRDLLKGAAAAAAGAAFLPSPATGAPTPGPRITVRRSGERGHANHGWLDTRHTFSFASYYDARHMGFRNLRVINEDFIDPGQGFPMHPHQDMEIVTYIVNGALQHKDSMGNGSVIVPGEAQRMSAGRGIFHSEYNPSKKEDVHLLQIWILPDARGTAPGYEQRSIPLEQRKGRLRLIASPDGRDGSIRYGTSTRLYASILAPAQEVLYRNGQGRHVWLQVVRGTVALNPGATNGVLLQPGDGASTSDAGELRLRASSDAELLLFDLA